MAASPSSSRGFTLLQVLVGAALGIVATLVVTRGFTLFNRELSRGMADTDADKKLKEIGLFFKRRLGGTQSFQHVGFRVSLGGRSYKSVGPGLVVVPDTQFDGSPSTAAEKSDLLFVVVRPTQSQALKLKTSVASDASTIELKNATDGSSILPDIAGRLLAVTTTQNTALVTAEAVTPLAEGGAEASVALTATALTHHYCEDAASCAANKLTQSFVSGDYVYLADIVQIGLDERTKTLKAVSAVAGGNPQFIADGVARFQLRYQLTSDAAHCPTVTTDGSATAPDEAKYRRDHWAELNDEATNGLCYERIASVQVGYDAEYPSNRSPASLARKRGTSYFFTASN